MVGAGVFSIPRNFAHGHRRLRRAHRLDDRRRRHADAGLRVPDAGQPQARSRRRRLRLCTRRLRPLPRLHLGLRLLGQRLRRQRLVLGADQVDARRACSPSSATATPCSPWWCRRSASGRSTSWSCAASRKRRRSTRSSPSPRSSRCWCSSCWRSSPSRRDVFVDNFWGGDGARVLSLSSTLFEQVKATMLITVFVFLGIEGASNYSRFAKKREDVGIATVIGFLGVLALFASVSILSYGVLPRAEMAGAEPALGGRRAGSGGRALGRDLHRRRRDRLGARRLPGLDADGRRGALHRRQEGRHAGLPGAGERQRGAVDGAADDHAAGAAGAGRHAVLRRRLHLRAVAVQPPVADALPARRRPTR